MCKGICTTPNSNLTSIHSLLNENSESELNNLLSNDSFQNKVGADLQNKIIRSKRQGTTILLETANSYNKTLITELCIWNKYRWNNGQNLRVKFLTRNPLLEEKIKRYAKEWETYANITFEFVADEDAEIRISLTPNFTSWSYVGRDCLQYAQDTATMNFGWFFSNTTDEEIRRVTLHEFGHALGCIHEHQHPNGNIPWNQDAVRRVYTAVHKWSESDINRNIFQQFPPAEISNSEYDKDSIMHYFFPKELTLSGFSFKENYELSQRDKDFIGNCYPKP